MKKPTNRAITTMSSKSNRLSLMCRASTLALAAAGLFASGSANAVPCFIPGPPPPNNVNINAPEDCVLIDANGHNNVNVNADVGGALGTTFYVNTATVGGRLTNNQTIFSADSVAFGMSDATIIGGITNNGIIQSTNDIALQLAYGSFVSQIVNDGTISGGVYGIDAIASSWAEGLINTEDGVIHGGSTAIRLTNNAFPGGGITNSGTIEGGVVGIRYDAVDSEDDAGITNDSRGLIQGGMDAGSSESTRVAIWIEGSSAEYHGDLTNHGVIEAYSGGFVFQAEELFGDIINTGSILAETGFGGVHVGGVIPTDTFVFHQTELFVGNFENTGLIDGGDSTGVFFGVDVLFSGKGQNDTLTQLVNRGRIEGGEAGFSVNAFVTGADFINDRRGVISSSDGTGVSLSSTIWFGNVLNQGLIEGDRVGMAIAADPIFGGKFNPFSVSSFNVGAESTGPAFNSFFVGTVENSGTISGVETGLLVDVGTFYGSIENSAVTFESSTV